MTKWIALPALAAVPAWTAEKPLFNGKDLTGWARIPRHEDSPSGQKPGFIVKDALLVSVPDAPEDLFQRHDGGLHYVVRDCAGRSTW